jgi:CD2 antigen cytoplasmic tail-binding protein 2
MQDLTKPSVNYTQTPRPLSCSSITIDHGSSPVSLTQTMAPRPSAKRPASETFASTSKKTRFLDPEEDPAHFSEQIESNLEDDPRTRRKGRVRTEGYESDSSDDGEGVVNSRKPANDAEGDDDDMFASTVPEEKKPVENAKKEKDKFLRLGDIEGQEFGLGDGSDSSESDEPEDEDDAERRKKAGMGYELSSFNMREEMEEGKFSADGSYIRTFDPHAVHDRWLEDTDEKEMKKARRVLKQREKMEREKQEAEEKELQDMGGKLAIEVQLLAKLRKGETVLEALQRLGVKKNKG